MDISYFPLLVSVMVTVMLIVPDIQLSYIVPQHILVSVNDFMVNSTHTEVLRSQLQTMFPHICPEEAMRQLLSSLYIPVITAMLLLSILFSTREVVLSRSKSAAVNTTINALILGIVTLSSRLNLHQVILLCCVSIITSIFMDNASKKAGLKRSPKTKKDFRSLLTPPPPVLSPRTRADKDSDKDTVRTQDLLSLSDFSTSSPVPSFQTAPVIPPNSFVPIGSPVFGASANRPRASPAASVRSGLLMSSDEFSFTHEFATNVEPGGEASRDCDLASLSLDDDLSRSPAPTTASITSEPPFSIREYSPLEDRLFKPQRKIIQPARFQPPKPTTNSWVAGGYWQPAQNLNLSLPLSRSSSQSSGFISGTASTLHRTPAMSLASTHTVRTSPPLRRENIEDSISDSSCPRGFDLNEMRRQGDAETRNKSVLDYSINISLRNILITLGFVVSVGTNVYYLFGTK